MLYEKNKMRNSYGVTPNIKINSRVNDLSVIGSAQETSRNSISSELTSSSRPNSTASEDDCTEEEDEDEEDEEEEDELTSEECQSSSSEDVQRNLALETISEEASTRKRSEAEDDGEFLNFLFPFLFFYFFLE